jgi:hypothetical protein
VTSAGRALLKRDALVVAVLVFDLWAIDVAYGRRRCDRRGGVPRMRDFVVVCYNTGHKSLEDAGWLGRAIHAWRMRR